MTANPMAPPTGAEIRQARLDRGLTIQKLARLAKVRWVTLRDWEEGRRAPRFDTMRRVIEALNQQAALPGIVAPKPSDEPPKA